MWIDLYGFAAQVEALRVGVWGCRGINPRWEVDCVRDALLGVVRGEKSDVMRRRARELGEEVRTRGRGEDIAAGVVARLAYHP